MISSTYRDTFGEGKFISWLLRRKHGTDSSNSGRFSCKVPLQQFTVTVEIVGIMEIKIPEMLLASLRVQFKPCTYFVVYIQPAKKMRELTEVGVILVQACDVDIVQFSQCIFHVKSEGGRIKR